jgi:hypothetical protein
MYDKKLWLFDELNSSSITNKDLLKSNYEYLNDYKEVLRIELKKTGKSLKDLKWSWDDTFINIEQNFINYSKQNFD